MELTGVAEAARWEETGIPERSWEKWLTEATSGLNDWLGEDGDGCAIYCQNYAEYLRFEPANNT